jgi:hypothetical protein
MFATDGSRAAAVAYCMLCHQLVRPGDRLLLVSCSYDHSTPGNDADVFKEYTSLAEELKVTTAAAVNSATLSHWLQD